MQLVCHYAASLPLLCGIKTITHEHAKLTSILWLNIQRLICSVVVKDLRLNDEDKDKASSFKDKDKDKDLMSKDEDKDDDLKIGPRGSSRTRTFLEDNNTVNARSQINARVF